MRTQEQKQQILNRYSNTIVHKNIVSNKIILHLLNIFYNSPKIVKNTGPVVLNYDPTKKIKEAWFNPVQELVNTIVDDDIFVWMSVMFRVEQPHILHNDDSLDVLYNLHKTVVLPLDIVKPTNFVIFDQSYLDGPVKLRRGAKKQHKIHYNKNLTDYTDIINYTDKPFDTHVWNSYLSHIPYESLHGLTVEKVVEWVPGDAIVFDTGKIHCGANFIKQGITTKTGLSIFTAKDSI